MMQNKHELSENKSDYPTVFGHHQLTVNEMLKVAEHYKAKDIHIEIQHNLSVPLAEGEDPIVKLQNELKTGRYKDAKYIAYVYTSGLTGDERPHAECVIISRESVIKPVAWAAGHELSLSNYPKAASADIRGIAYDKRLVPQADFNTCASLSFAYIKELLKNNGAQMNKMNNLTLSIPYMHQNEVRYLFVPSPQVLKYSQSEKYNKYIYGMVTKDNMGMFEHNGENIQYTTLTQMLKTVIEKSNDPDAIQEAKLALGKLKDFRKEWQKAYEEMQIERANMRRDGMSRHIAYKSKKYEKIAMRAAVPEGVVALVEQMELRKAEMSGEQLLETFSSEITKNFTFSKMEDKELSQIAYFMNALSKDIPSETVFKFLLKNQAISTALLGNDRAYMYFSFQLNSKTRRALKNFLLESEELHNQLRSTNEVIDVLGWLDALKIPEDQKIDFLKKHAPDNFGKILSERIINMIQRKDSHNYLSYFENRSTIATLVETFMPPEWLYSDKNKAIVAPRLIKFKPLFHTNEDFTAFCEQHYPLKNAVNYMDDLDDLDAYIANRSDALFEELTHVGSPLTQKLLSNYRRFLMIIDNHCDDAQIEKLVIIHKDTLLNSMFSEKNFFLGKSMLVAQKHHLISSNVEKFAATYKGIDRDSNRKYFLVNLLCCVAEPERRKVLLTVSGMQEEQDKAFITEVLDRCEREAPKPALVTPAPAPALVTPAPPAQKLSSKKTLIPSSVSSNFGVRCLSAFGRALVAGFMATGFASGASPAVVSAAPRYSFFGSKPVSGNKVAPEGEPTIRPSS